MFIKEATTAGLGQNPHRTPLTSVTPGPGPSHNLRVPPPAPPNSLATDHSGSTHRSESPPNSEATHHSESTGSTHRSESRSTHPSSSLAESSHHDRSHSESSPLLPAGSIHEDSPPQWVYVQLIIFDFKSVTRIFLNAGPIGWKIVQIAYSDAYIAGHHPIENLLWSRSLDAPWRASFFLWSGNTFFMDRVLHHDNLDGSILNFNKNSNVKIWIRTHDIWWNYNSYSKLCYSIISCLVHFLHHVRVSQNLHHPPK